MQEQKKGLQVVRKVIDFLNPYKRLASRSGRRSVVEWLLVAMVPIAISFKWAHFNKISLSWGFGDCVCFTIIMYFAPAVVRSLKGAVEAGVWYTRTRVSWIFFGVGVMASGFFYGKSQLFGTKEQKASDNEPPALLHFALVPIAMQWVVPIILGVIYGKREVPSHIRTIVLILTGVYSVTLASDWGLLKLLWHLLALVTKILHH